MKTFKFFLCLVGACVLVMSAQAQTVLSKKMYKSYRGLVMAGYQGWHNAQGDGANRGWYHYTRKGQFKPGFTNVDLWPDVSEYEILILRHLPSMMALWLVFIPIMTIPQWIPTSVGCKSMVWMACSCSAL